MQKRDLLLTSTHVFLIGREKQKAGPNKGEFLEVIKRQLSMSDIAGVAMSTRQDGFVILRVPAECVLASFCGSSVLHVLLLCVVVACCVACYVLYSICCARVVCVPYMQPEEGHAQLKARVYWLRCTILCCGAFHIAPIAPTVKFRSNYDTHHKSHPARSSTVRVSSHSFGLGTLMAMTALWQVRHPH